MQPSAQHFQKAANDIFVHGDNDTLPYNSDTRLAGARATEISDLCGQMWATLSRLTEGELTRKLRAAEFESERLLIPSGPTGFRVVSRIHPVWAVYANGFALALLEQFEHSRKAEACSYRKAPDGEARYFHPDFSWRAFKIFSADRAETEQHCEVIVQTDISSFYERVSHHTIENLIHRICGTDVRPAKQILELLGRTTADRSFGLPVGGQASRVLAELFLCEIDNALEAKGVRWLRYVDDIVLFCSSAADAHRSLGVLAEVLANYGLSLNKSKTLLMPKAHYSELTRASMRGGDDDASSLRAIDLHFDPYSDSAVSDYESLKRAVAGIDIHRLLARETEKSVPDSFLIAQIGRTMKLHDPDDALSIARTLLAEKNLHAFRGSWSTVMRGIAALRSDERFQSISDPLDHLIDLVPDHSDHLLVSEGALLHYIRTLRQCGTPRRDSLLQTIFGNGMASTLRAACIECWSSWQDRTKFVQLRNVFDSLPTTCQRQAWLMSNACGDEGHAFRRMAADRAKRNWHLGVEPPQTNSFFELFQSWASTEPHAN
jgi:hypothetical protein